MDQDPDLECGLLNNSDKVFNVDKWLSTILKISAVIYCFPFLLTIAWFAHLNDISNLDFNFEISIIICSASVNLMFFITSCYFLFTSNCGGSKKIYTLLIVNNSLSSVVAILSTICLVNYQKNGNSLESYLKLFIYIFNCLCFMYVYSVLLFLYIMHSKHETKIIKQSLQRGPIMRPGVIY